MNAAHYISLDELCSHYRIEQSFMLKLNEAGLIELQTIEKVHCVHADCLADVEKMIRMHQELEINLEGIDTIFHLLSRIDQLQEELEKARSQLRIHGAL